MGCKSLLPLADGEKWIMMWGAPQPSGKEAFALDHSFLSPCLPRLPLAPAQTPWTFLRPAWGGWMATPFHGWEGCI